jgi:hypothetical protein
MNHAQLAGELSEVLGRKINYVNESLEHFETRLKNIGSIQAHRIQHFLGVYADYQNGIFAGINDVVERLTGQVPVTVREYVESNRKDFQRA